MASKGTAGPGSGGDRRSAAYQAGKDLAAGRQKNLNAFFGASTQTPPASASRESNRGAEGDERGSVRSGGAPTSSAAPVSSGPSGGDGAGPRINSVPPTSAITQLLPPNAGDADDSTGAGQREPDPASGREEPDGEAPNEDFLGPDVGGTDEDESDGDDGQKLDDSNIRDKVGSLKRPCPLGSNAFFLCQVGDERVP